jgi:hypothetical protein
LQVLGQIVARTVGEAGGDQAFFKMDALADADASVVHVRATAFGGGEQVVAGGVVHDSLLDFAFHGQSDADAIHGQAVDEVGGAVQRVDDPYKLRVLRTVFGARLLRPNAMAWVGCEQRLNNHFFTSDIDLGHKVVDLLARDAHRLNIQRSAVDKRASSTSSLDGHVDHGV